MLVCDRGLKIDTSQDIRPARSLTDHFSDPHKNFSFSGEQNITILYKSVHVIHVYPGKFVELPTGVKSGKSNSKSSH